MHPVPYGATTHITAPNTIPPITHELGRHWDQPDTDNFVIDDTHVMMTRRDFEQLAEYSTTNPSGAYEGKCWKAQTYVKDDKWYPSGPWVLRWFGVSTKGPGYVSNNERIILIID
jgi:hypothetical protein